MSIDIIVGKKEKQRARRMLKSFFEWRNRPDAYAKFLKNTRKAGHTPILLPTIFKEIDTHPFSSKKTSIDYDKFMYTLADRIVSRCISFDWESSPEGLDYWVKAFYGEA